MKTSENDVKYSSLNMREMDKSRELYSREGDNSNSFKACSDIFHFPRHVYNNLMVFWAVHVILQENTMYSKMLHLLLAAYCRM